MNERERALDHKCPGCGSKLLFTPEIGKWKCDNCKGEYDLETLQKYNNASSVTNNSSEGVKEDDTNYIEYHCKNCGAEIIADEQTASTFCVYCGNTAILQNKLSGKFAPSKIIPFKKSKNDAIEAFKSLYKGRVLMPKFFNDEKNIEKISGVYIPFWLFSYDTNGRLNVDAKKVTSWTSGNTVYTKTDTYSVQREADMKFIRIPVDGSTRFDDDIMNTIEPFDYKEFVDYNHAYLSGFLAEKYDVVSDEAEKIALERAQTSAINALNSSIVGYTSKTILSSEINRTLTNKEYVLLPVWMVNVKYNDKYYTFAMNAQTGEFVGNIPVDVKKAVIIGGSIFLILTLVIILVSYIMYLGGN